MIAYKIHSLQERPDLIDRASQLGGEVWPEFLLHNDSGHFWSALFETFLDFQFMICDGADVLAAAGHTLPVAWDGTLDDLPSGFDEVIERGVRDHARGRAPNALSALAAITLPVHRGKGLSSLILRRMRAIAADHGFHSLIAPVRPTHKSAYPLTPMERYIEWKNGDGSPFDPWLRTHWRLGATILRVAPASVITTGTVAKWEEWAGMRFPESGHYIVPGALVPVEIDRERDLGRYTEPNVWMRHPVTPEDLEMRQ